nr:putative ribonuclease h protein [Quercus suber]
MEGPLNIDEDLLLIRDMIYEGSWNLNLCSFDFPTTLRMKIKAIPIPFLDAGVDGLCWSNSSSGEFNRRSAYKLACGVSQLQCSFKGQWIWKLDALLKIQCFVWKCYMKCLPVKSLLVHRGIAKVDQCEGCGSELETILHMLRDCVATHAEGLENLVIQELKDL